MQGVIRRGVAAGAIAGMVSGAPSTIHAVVTGRDPLEAARAAGNVVLGAEAPALHLLAAGAAVHAVVSVLWGTVLAVLLPRRRPVAWGAAAGLAIAAVDLGAVGRRRPLVRALAPLPQVADHVAFGTAAAALLRSWR